MPTYSERQQLLRTPRHMIPHLREAERRFIAASIHINEDTVLHFIDDPAPLVRREVYRKRYLPDAAAERALSGREQPEVFGYAVRAASRERMYPGFILALIDKIREMSDDATTNRFAGFAASNRGLSRESLQLLVDIWLATLPKRSTATERRLIEAAAKRFIRHPGATGAVREAMEPFIEEKGVLDDSPAMVKRYIAEAETTDDADRLRVLSTHRVREVRLAVVKRDICPPDVLATVMRDRTRKVRRQAAKHPSTPAESLVSAITDVDDADVPYFALKNPSTPAHIVNEVILGSSIDMREARRNYGIKSSEFASFHPGTSSDALLVAVGRFIETYGSLRYRREHFGVGLRRFALHPNATDEVLRLVINNLPDETGLSRVVSGICKQHDFSRFEDLMAEFALADNPIARTFAIQHPATPEEYRVFGSLLS